jgi:hypothetical protein
MGTTAYAAITISCQLHGEALGPVAALVMVNGSFGGLGGDRYAAYRIRSAAQLHD